MRGEASACRLTTTRSSQSKDAEALEKRGKYFAEVGPEMSKRLLLQYGNLNAQTQVTGAMPNYLDIRKFTLASGRFFNEAEETGMRRVAVVGSAVIDNLGLQTPEALIGENVSIGGLQFEVIGVLAVEGSDRRLRQQSRRHRHDSAVHGAVSRDGNDRAQLDRRAGGRVRTRFRRRRRTFSRSCVASIGLPPERRTISTFAIRPSS